jgi:hypothetical protein
MEAANVGFFDQTRASGLRAVEGCPGCGIFFI